MQEKIYDNMKIALILRSLRGVLGMSQTEFAQWIDVPRSTITRAENLRLPLKVSVFLQIVRMVEERGIIINPLSEEPNIQLTKTFIDAEYEKLKST